ncbi:hypothetical protein FEE95_05490 [Maribacter algarum]|uniref:DUF378 domain-containing protein n=1 Tax=Maribacter algarum (ex Zhang et al. 2020) TaxID=2578118 RepID=A0A5S3PV50_9FLAO|nr:hypothetical protein [Maribacter algarum]TMM58886.1 hypothetical protein FEE95_05490 [Maribacter algarum]
METQKKLQLQKSGGILALLGLGSILLSLFDYSFMVLAWIDFFGDTVAWIIRIGLIAIGLTLYFKYDVDDADLFFEEDEDEPD